MRVRWYVLSLALTFTASEIHDRFGPLAGYAAGTALGAVGCIAIWLDERESSGHTCTEERS